MDPRIGSGNDRPTRRLRHGALELEAAALWFEQRPIKLAPQEHMLMTALILARAKSRPTPLTDLADLLGTSKEAASSLCVELDRKLSTATLGPVGIEAAGERRRLRVAPALQRGPLSVYPGHGLVFYAGSRARFSSDDTAMLVWILTQPPERLGYARSPARAQLPRESFFEVITRLSDALRTISNGCCQLWVLPMEQIELRIDQLPRRLRRGALELDRKTSTATLGDHSVKLSMRHAAGLALLLAEPVVTLAALRTLPFSASSAREIIWELRAWLLHEFGGAIVISTEYVHGYRLHVEPRQVSLRLGRLALTGETLQIAGESHALSATLAAEVALLLANPGKVVEFTALQLAPDRSTPRKRFSVQRDMHLLRTLLASVPEFSLRSVPNRGYRLVEDDPLWIGQFAFDASSGQARGPLGRRRLGPAMTSVLCRLLVHHGRAVPFEAFGAQTARARATLSAMIHRLHAALDELLETFDVLNVTTIGYKLEIEGADIWRRNGLSLDLGARSVSFEGSEATLDAQQLLALMVLLIWTPEVVSRAELRGCCECGDGQLDQVLADLGWTLSEISEGRLTIVQTDGGVALAGLRAGA